MKLNRYALGCLAGLLVALACLSGPATARPVTLAVSQSFFALPALIAAHEGYFDDPTSPVSVVPCMGGVRCLQMLTEGKVQFATAGDMPIAASAFRPNPPLVLATLASSSQNTKLLVTAASGVQSFAELSGKRVALVRYSNAHYQLDVSVLFARGDPAALTIVPAEPNEIVDMLKSAKVDGAIVWEPDASRALASVPGLRQIRGSRIYIESFNLIANRESARDESARVVLRGLIRAVALIEKQPQLAIAIAVRQLKITPEQAQQLLATYHFDIGLGQGLIMTMESQARWMMSHGLVPKSVKLPNYLNMVQSAPLRELNPVLVTLVQ